MKKRVAFIARNIHRGGVHRYLSELIRHLTAAYSDQFEFILIYNEEMYTNAFENVEYLYINQRNKFIFDYIASYRAVKKSRADIVIYPKLIIPLNHIFLKCKKINVIHDMGYFEKKMKLYPPADTLFMKTFLKPSCQIANKTLTVSNFSRNDAIKKLKLKENEIVTVHEGVESSFFTLPDPQKESAAIEKFELQTPYLFFSGSINPRKNLTRVLDAFSEIKDTIPHQIYITGINPWSYKPFKEHVEKLGLQNRVKVLGFVADEELIILYRHAALFVYVSLYEGFGLPIIEAQACGCPVLTSNVTSCPEIAGESALVVDPYSVTAIRDGIMKIVTDSAFREELITRGNENCRKYDWHHTAGAVAALIDHLY